MWKFLILLISVLLFLSCDEMTYENNSNLSANLNLWNEEIYEPLYGMDDKKTDISRKSENFIMLNSITGSEFSMDDPVVVPSKKQQIFPSVAFDGENYFAVWTDSINDDSSDMDIYGTRITKSGNIIDNPPIIISNEEKQQGSPKILFDGTNYFVVWADSRNNYKNDIYGARITKQGEVIDPKGIKISNSSNGVHSPEVSFDGENYFVVWNDRRNSTTEDQYYDVYGARLTTHGEVLDKDGIAICTAPNQQDYPVVSFNGNNYLVVWGDNRNDTSPSQTQKYDIYGARVTKSGTVLDQNGFEINTFEGEQYNPAVVNNNSEFFVAWTDSRNGYDIYGTRISSEGNVLDINGVLISSSASSSSPVIQFDGNNNIVIWQDERNGTSDIYGSRVTTDGVVLDINGIAISNAINDQLSPAIACGEDNYLAVWYDKRNYTDKYDEGYDDIYGRIVSFSGELLNEDNFIVSAMENSQLFSSIAFDGENYLAVWKDNRNSVLSDDSSYYNIIGVRVSKNGDILDPDGIEICTAPNGQHDPKVAFDGENYLVVWTDQRNNSYEIFGGRVSKEGKVLDGNGFPISGSAGTFPQILFNGESYFVVWLQSQDFQFGKIIGTTVDKSGMTHEEITISEDLSPSEKIIPAIAYNGKNHVVVWAHQNFIYSRTISKELNEISESNIVSSGSNPDIASDGNNFFVVWSAVSSSSDIFGTFLKSEGIPFENEIISICLNPKSQINPVVTFDSTGYIILWEDSRNASDQSSETDYEIYGTRISIEGFFIGKEFAVSENSSINKAPAISASGYNNALITYQRYDKNNNYSSIRIAGKIFSSGQGTKCKIDSDCSTLSCINEICCITKSCDDGNSCTIDSCNISGNGTCTNVPGNEGTSCDDGDPLTENDICIEGTCTGYPAEIDDDFSDKHLNDDDSSELFDQNEIGDEDVLEDNNSGCGCSII